MLTLHIGGDTANDPVELDAISRRLIDELRSVDGAIVEIPQGEPSPTGAKSPTVEVVSQITIAIVSGTVSATVPLIFETVRDWLVRQRSDTTITVRGRNVEATVQGDSPDAAFCSLLEIFRTEAAVK